MMGHGYQSPAQGAWGPMDIVRFALGNMAWGFGHLAMRMDMGRKANSIGCLACGIGWVLGSFGFGGVCGLWGWVIGCGALGMGHAVLSQCKPVCPLVVV